jgi:hypothetical protein
MTIFSASRCRPGPGAALARLYACAGGKYPPALLPFTARRYATILDRNYQVRGQNRVLLPLEAFPARVDPQMEGIEISHSSVLAARQTIDPASMPPRPKAPAWVNNPNAPTVLYNGMIAPIIPYRRFKHTDGSLVARGGEPLQGFAVAGADRPQSGWVTNDT